MPRGIGLSKDNSKGPLRKVGAKRGSNAMHDMGRGPNEKPVRGKRIAGNVSKGGKRMPPRRPKPGRGVGKATGRGMVGKGFEPGKTVF